MHDARFDNLAKLLVEYSTRLKRNENVLIEAFDVPDEMTIALIRAVRKAGAIPFVQVQRARIGRELALEASDRQLTQTPARNESVESVNGKNRPRRNQRTGNGSAI